MRQRTHCSPAARSGELLVNDVVLAVQGVACSADRRVAQLLRLSAQIPVLKSHEDLATVAAAMSSSV